ncbi:acyltransferase [Ochrovirga pacifica]|uniref:acyltransferase n=1 Tax=Ochrovirga pacifica TaxID=1042376 RepID=UPI0002559DF9|nr:hypothetical protein [Ochrovirga pacifica]
MVKIGYSNMPKGTSKVKFTISYYLNIARSWYTFNIKYPWVSYGGFVRVMKQTSFAKRDIKIGHRVQFGQYCNIASDVHFGNHVLMAGRVCFVGKNDHMFDVPGKYIWDGERGEDGITVVEDDVWIGHGCNIIAGVTIGKGAIVAAGSLVNKDIPPCEIWGGVPAKKIRDRFNEDMKNEHLMFLKKARR